MNRIIYILRHAKTKRGGVEAIDYERQLTTKGISDTTRLGEWLQQIANPPGRIIASSAPRGHHTASIVANALDIADKDIEYDRRLYGATITRWLQKLRQLDDRSVRSILLVGHNPELELLARKLTAVKYIKLPPCGLLAIQSTVPWAKTGLAGTSGAGTLLWSKYPRRYSDIRPEITAISGQAVEEALNCLPRACRTDKSRRFLSAGILTAVNRILAKHEDIVTTPPPPQKKSATRKTGATKKPRRQVQG